MSILRLLPLTLAAAAVAACGSGNDRTGDTPADTTAPPVTDATTPDAGDALRNAQGGSVGQVTVTPQSDGGLLVAVSVSGMPAGTYGTHIHEKGLCDAPAFTTAGDHWNPTNRQHGRLNPEGAHHGDLPNLTVGQDGAGSLSFALPSAEAGGAGLFDTDGAALVVHAQRDDERTNPSGNSGDRIACAVLTQR